MALRGILRNSAAVAIGRTGDKALAILCGIVLARALGPARLGTFSFVFAYLGFFQVLIGLGIRDVLARDVAREPEGIDRLLGGGMSLKMLSSLAVVLLANAVVRFLPIEAAVRPYVLLASLGSLASFSALYNVALQVRMRMERATLVGLLSGATKLLLFTVLAWAAGGIRAFIVAGLGSACVSLILMVLATRDIVRPSLTADYRLWCRLLRDSWPLIVVQGLTMVYHRIDQVMLYGMVAREGMGYYSAAVRVAEAMRIIPMAIMTPLFPLLSVAWIRSRERFLGLYAAAITTSIAFSFPVLLLIQLEGGTLIRLLYGPAYGPTAVLASVLVWGELFLFFHLINACVLIAMNEQRLLIAIISVSAGVNILLNALLIPVLGVVGAAVATLVSYAILPGSVAFFRASKTLVPVAITASWRVVATGVVSVIAGVALTRVGGMPRFVPTTIAAGVYVGGLAGQKQIRQWVAMGLASLRDQRDATSAGSD